MLQLYKNNKDKILFYGILLGSLGVLYLVFKKFVFSTFDDFYVLIKKSEGGWVSDPQDNGGQTFRGIAINFNPEYADKIKNRTLTESEAKSIFKRKYYEPMKIGLINNAKLRYQMADHSINAGQKTAVKLLQRVLKLKETGIMDSSIVKKVNLADESKFPIVDKYKQARRDYYNAIIAKKPNQAKFRTSWLSRIDSDKHLFKT